MQKKGRGRPKQKVEIPFEDLQNPQAIGEDHLILPAYHGLTYDQLKVAEANDQNAASNVFSTGLPGRPRKDNNDAVA